jgi:hypothetical protein
VNKKGENRNRENKSYLPKITHEYKLTNKFASWPKLNQLANLSFHVDFVGARFATFSASSLMHWVRLFGM